MPIKETIRLNDLNTKMTGKELYPVIGGGSALSPLQAKIVQSHFKRLSLYGSCIEKNWIVKRYLPGFVMAVGAVRVISADNKGAFGYDFNPPFELHAWLMNREGVVDFSLPSLILCGSAMGDEEGPYVVGREPCILIGEPPEWVRYKIYHIIDDAKVRQALRVSTRYDA